MPTLGRLQMKQEIVCEPHDLVKLFDESETDEIEKQWMFIFCKNKQGYNTKAFKWHIFSGGAFPALDAEKAHEAYGGVNETQYIVMGNDHEQAILVGSKPMSCNLSDYYVFPANMAWTMAFTHEEGWLGPYFARHPNNKKLESENEKLREKERQKELARSNGWM